jgi:hypothetical protein
MVTSHDCHFDKEWNRVRASLTEEGMAEDEASRAADSDTSLDRTFTASPLVPPEHTELDLSTLMAGRIVGYFPVPRSEDGTIPEAVVDLTYRVTLDRLDISRVACISDGARSQLRYALARVDSLRATSVGFQLEQVVGHRIDRVSVPKRQPLFVRLHLDDGTTIELIQQPVEPEEGPARAPLSQ